MYSRIIFSLVYATKSVLLFKELGTNLDDIQSVKKIESSTEKTSTSLPKCGSNKISIQMVGRIGSRKLIQLRP